MCPGRSQLVQWRVDRLARSTAGGTTVVGGLIVRGGVGADTGVATCTEGRAEGTDRGF